MFDPFQFAGTLSDGLGKTMDNRHQSEREYIRYHAATSGEHLVAGIHGLAHGKSRLPGERLSCHSSSGPFSPI